MKKQFFYPLRNSENPYDVQLVPVTEEVYQSVIPEIERTRKQMQRSGRCICPKSMLWTCDGDCAICPYSISTNIVSLDARIEETDDLTIGDTLVSDDPSPENIVMNRELIESLFEELKRLDPDGSLICKLIMRGKTEREAAEYLGLSKSAYRARWKKTKKKLLKKLL